MSWLFSRALVEASLGESSSDGEPSAPLSGTPTPQAYCAPDRMTDFSRPSRFGMTFGPLTEDLGATVLTWCLADSLARTSASQEKATALMESEADSGQKWHGSLAKYDPDSRSWKTAQRSLLGDSEEFSETWPRWGLMRSGELFLLPMPALPIDGNESGFWQTPVADDAIERKAGKWNSRGEPKLSAQVLLYPTVCARDYRGIGRSRMERTGSKSGECLPQVIGGLLNPTWAEWLMGWPLGWTELEPSATDKYLNVPPLLGEYSLPEPRSAA